MNWVSLIQPESEALLSLNTENSFDDSVTTFGARVAAARSAEGLTVERLAEQVGVEHATLSAWESDDLAPRANKIQMLSGVLNVSLVWLISGKSNGSDYVEQTHDRPDAVNETLSEIRSLKQMLELSLSRISDLEDRLVKAG